MMAQQMSRGRCRKEHSDDRACAPKEENGNEKEFRETEHDEKRAKNMWSSYREELKAREPQAVNEGFTGGAFGCPGEYFWGAAVFMRGCGFRKRCDECWNRPYEEEEWIPYEKRNA